MRLNLHKDQMKFTYHWNSGLTAHLHEEVVKTAQRQFEEKLANSEHQMKWAIQRRRDTSASVAEKHQARQCLKNIRENLNQDYTKLIQVGERMDLKMEVENQINFVYPFLAGVCRRAQGKRINYKSNNNLKSKR